MVTVAAEQAAAAAGGLLGEAAASKPWNWAVHSQQEPAPAPASAALREAGPLHWLRVVSILLTEWNTVVACSAQQTRLYASAI